MREIIHVDNSVHQRLVLSAPIQYFCYIAQYLLRLGGGAGRGIADGVFRHGGDLGVLHGLTDDVGHARLLGPTVGVLLGSLLVDMLGLEGAVSVKTFIHPPSHHSSPTLYEHHTIIIIIIIIKFPIT